MYGTSYKTMLVYNISIHYRNYIVNNKNRYNTNKFCGQYLKFYT